MKTSSDQRRSLPGVASSLKPGVTFEQLDQLAQAMTDNEVARQLTEARIRLFQSINNTSQMSA